MTGLKTVFGSLAAIAMLAMPSPALGEYLIPPGNSAATQYTEAYPTGGGNRSTKPTGEGRSRSPAEVVGEQNARNLESRGPAGRATAEVAAATAPGGGVAASTDGPGNSGGANGDGQDSPGTAGAAGDGSSGLGAVVAEATGSSSDGELGLLLPLAIVAAIAWALAYLWRQRKRQTA